MTPSQTSSDRKSVARVVPGILGAALVSIGFGLVVGVYLGIFVGVAALVVAVGAFLLLADRQIR